MLTWSILAALAVCFLTEHGAAAVDRGVESAVRAESLSHTSIR